MFEDVIMAFYIAAMYRAILRSHGALMWPLGLMLTRGILRSIFRKKLTEHLTGVSYGVDQANTTLAAFINGFCTWTSLNHVLATQPLSSTITVRGPLSRNFGVIGLH